MDQRPSKSLLNQSSVSKQSGKDFSDLKSFLKHEINKYSSMLQDIEQKEQSSFVGQHEQSFESYNCIDSTRQRVD